MKSTKMLFIAVLLLLAACAFALGQEQIVTTREAPNGFHLIQPNLPTILVDGNDDVGVVRVANDFQADISRVCGRKPELATEAGHQAKEMVIVGTLGKSGVVRELVRTGKLNMSDIQGKWEANVTQVVEDPMPGVSRALVIAGSDKRGAIYGVYNLSEQIGVSPWYWWADVPVAHHDTLWVKAGRHVQGEPKVKYRGIFLNDEAPDLTNWVLQNFGDYNSKFYPHIFELLLRLRANYLWPAMWNNCFNEDDPQNMVLADHYGIVMGTSHVEPMMRADKEWNRLGHSANDWNYVTHAQELEKFWTDGVVRNKPYESITTIAMRGKIDTPMSETANIELLEKIVAAQRKILAENVNPDVTRIPQLWALYKEVQEYYEKGMRVPDDVTLLWCDDNWGNIRRLPAASERARSGGAGVYYHFDYVGGPRNYKWMNTNPLPKIWEQMNLAYHYMDDRIWIVNVGSLKTKELPIEFFLTFARDPDALPADKIAAFTRAYAARNFGEAHASEIGDLLSTYGKYAGRRKPELIDPSSFSLENYREADRVVADWLDLDQRASKLYNEMDADHKSAFFQLVYHPIRAQRIVNQLYLAVAKNRLYAKQGRESANYFAQQARSLLTNDQAEQEVWDANNNGKWKHFMDQTHIGYTSWQQPDTNVMPALSTYDETIDPGVGVAVEGSNEAWPGGQGVATLPEADPWSPAPIFTVFQRGKESVASTVRASVPWVHPTEVPSEAPSEKTYRVDVDWSSAPKQGGTVQLRVDPSGGPSIPIVLQVRDLTEEAPIGFKGFLESRGYVSIEPQHYSSIKQNGGAHWGLVPDYGRTASGMTILPVDAPTAEPGATSPCLEYRIYSPKSGQVGVETVWGPSLGFQPGRGLRFAVSFDDEKPQVMDLTAVYMSPQWEESVRTNSRPVLTKHNLAVGAHTLKVWMVDPGVVLQNILVDYGGLKESYLGPEESHRIK